jgi:hypothetical protein
LKDKKQNKDEKNDRFGDKRDIREKSTREERRVCEEKRSKPIKSM